jgi:hypothetical protein
MNTFMMYLLLFFVSQTSQSLLITTWFNDPVFIKGLSFHSTSSPSFKNQISRWLSSWTIVYFPIKSSFLRYMREFTQFNIFILIFFNTIFSIMSSKLRRSHLIQLFCYSFWHGSNFCRAYWSLNLLFFLTIWDWIHIIVWFLNFRPLRGPYWRFWPFLLSTIFPNTIGWTFWMEFDNVKLLNWFWVFNYIRNIWKVQMLFFITILLNFLWRQISNTWFWWKYWIQRLIWPIGIVAFGMSIDLIF